MIGKRSFAKRNPEQSVSKVIDLLGRGYSLFEINRRLTEIPEVRTAVNMIAETVSTVPFYHIRERPVMKHSNMRRMDYVDDSFYYVFSVRANPYQSPQAFFSNVTARLYYNNNVFVMPEWDVISGGLKALYPLPVSQFEFRRQGEDEYIIFPELGTSFLYSDILHFQRFPDIDQGAKRQAIYTYTDIVANMQAAAGRQLEASGKIKALLISSTGLKTKQMKAELEEFKENFLTSQNVTGFGMLNANYQVVPIDYNNQPIDTEIMKELVQGIYNYMGVSTSIINGTATELEYQQFVNRLDATLQQYTQEMTYKLFAPSNIRRGDRIVCDKLALEIATLASRTQFIDKSIYQGTMTRNEARNRIGLGWIEGGDELLTNKNAQNIQDVNREGGDGNAKPQNDSVSGQVGDPGGTDGGAGEKDHKGVSDPV